MPFLIQGKTNWKFIAIVIVLAIIVGGGTLGYWWWMEREELETPSIEIPERVVEKEIIEEEITEDKTVKCKIHTYKEIMGIANGLFNETSQASYDFLNSLFNNPVDLLLVSDDEALIEYLIENLTADPVDRRPNLTLKWISRGRFDKNYLNKEMVIVSFEEAWVYRGLPHTRVIIFQEETEGKWCASYQDIGYAIELYEPQKLIKEEPEFFITYTTGIGGTCVPYHRYFGLYRMENGTFHSIFETIVNRDGRINGGPIEGMNTTIDFKDLDEDGNLEIIKEGTRKICKGPLGACYVAHCDEVIKEEEIYQVFKWDPQKQTFVEEIIQ